MIKIMEAAKALLFSAVIGLLMLPQARASSNLAAGSFAQAVRTGQSQQDVGICQLMTGPRDGLADNRFMLTLGDSDLSDGHELVVTGKFKEKGPRWSMPRELELIPDEDETAQYLEDLLRKELDDRKLDLRLHKLKVEVDHKQRAGQVVQFTCKLHLTGRVVSKMIGSGSVTLTFKGLGQFIPGFDEQRSATGMTTTSAAPAADQCPLSSLAPAGLAPLNGQYCANSQNCLINFLGYQWWTSYAYFGPPFPQQSYFWNANNQWAPQNATVDAEGLHLFISNQDLGGGSKPSAAEVVAMFKADDSPASLGYGDYLVTAKIKTAASWQALDPNVTFGAFTYERLGTAGTGSGDQNNPYRELDLAEISHWGYAGPLLPPSPPANPPASCLSPQGNQLPDPRLCTGNTQFTVQLWNQGPDNLHRYSINSSADTVTLVMRWHGPQQPVTFEQYDGSFGFSSLSATPNNTWTTSGSQNPFIPATNCERFHLNFWMGDYADASGGFNPPPATLPQEVVVTNFQFQPL
jgi:hypothetical protein